MSDRATRWDVGEVFMGERPKCVWVPVFLAGIITQCWEWQQLRQKGVKEEKQKSEKEIESEWWSKCLERRVKKSDRESERE